MREDVITLCKELRNKEFNFNEIVPLEVTYQLLQLIGDKDAEVRDHLVYPVLAHLLHDDVLEKKELDIICNLLLSDEYLFYDIENKEEYSVLTRSFTLLQLAILIYKHNQKPILLQSTFDVLLEKSLLYFELESDVRGYVKEVGWAHSVAHFADLLAQIYKSPGLHSEYIIKSLNIIKKKLVIRESQFIHEEDERMVNAIVNLLELQDIGNDEFIIWVQSFTDFDMGVKYPEAYNIQFNAKKFIRSLYFRLVENKDYIWLTDVLRVTALEIKKKR